MALNSKSKWRKLSGDGNDGSSVRNVLISDAEPELCVKLLETPSLKNFSGLRARLEKANKEWLNEFLNLGGMSCLLDSLSSLSSGDRQNRFIEALDQIECVRCIKAVMNSPVGLAIMTASNELTRSLVKGKILGFNTLNSTVCKTIDDSYKASKYFKYDWR